jgi:hypothetical protein
VLSDCHMPFRSGFPSDVRDALYTRGRSAAVRKSDGIMDVIIHTVTRAFVMDFAPFLCI